MSRSCTPNHEYTVAARLNVWEKCIKEDKDQLERLKYNELPQKLINEVDILPINRRIYQQLVMQYLVEESEYGENIREKLEKAKNEARLQVRSLTELSMFGVWKIVLENGIEVTSNYKRIDENTERWCVTYYSKVFEIRKLLLPVQLKQNLWEYRVNLDVDIAKLLRQFILTNKPKHWSTEFNDEVNCIACNNHQSYLMTRTIKNDQSIFNFLPVSYTFAQPNSKWSYNINESNRVTRKIVYPLTNRYIMMSEYPHTPKKIVNALKLLKFCMNL